MQLRPPLSLRLVRPLIFSLLCLLVVLPIVTWLLQVGASGEWRHFLLVAPMIIALALALSLQATWMWRASSWRLIADDIGITLRYRSHITKILWSQVVLCREEASPQERDGASWITLRGEHDEVLLMWERSWFGYSKSSLRRFDQFTEFVRLKVASK